MMGNENLEFGRAYAVNLEERFYVGTVDYDGCTFHSFVNGNNNVVSHLWAQDPRLEGDRTVVTSESFRRFLTTPGEKYHGEAMQSICFGEDKLRRARV